MRGQLPPQFFAKVVHEISLKSMSKYVGGGSSKYSEEFWKMIDQHQQHQALRILKRHKKGLVCGVHG